MSDKLMGLLKRADDLRQTAAVLADELDAEVYALRQFAQVRRERREPVAKAPRKAPADPTPAPPKQAPAPRPAAPSASSQRERLAKAKAAAAEKATCVACHKELSIVAFSKTETGRDDTCWRCRKRKGGKRAGAAASPASSSVCVCVLCGKPVPSSL